MKFSFPGGISSKYRVPEIDDGSDAWLSVLGHSGDSQSTLEAESSIRRERLIIFLIVVVGLVLAGRLVQLQLFQGNHNRALADGNRIRSQTVFAPRGIIYDRNHKVLARNLPKYQISITLSDLPKDRGERSRLLQRISDTSHITTADLESGLAEQQRRNPYGSATFKKPVDQQTALILQSESGRIPSVSLVISPARDYEAGPAFSHILGYSGSITQEELQSRPNSGYDVNDTIGKTGVEQSYESVLRGQNGKEQIEVDSSGKQSKILGNVDPVPGNDLTLSIDAGLQQKFYDSLGAMITKLNSPGGAGVAIDPSTGEVLAMVSYPSYEPNLFANGISAQDYDKLLKDVNKPLINRSISGTYPSGSTIKPFLALSALEEGTITPNTTIQGVAQIKVGDSTFPDWTLHSGAVNVFRAIAESVNIFFYGVAGGFNIPGVGSMKGLGPETIAKDLGKMYFSRTTGIDLANEATGQIPTPEWKEKVKHEQWFLGDSYHEGIGQGDLLVTPLQMAVATAAIANNGKLLKPTLLHQINSNSGSLIRTSQSTLLNGQIAPQSAIDTVRQAMRQTVTGGTARPLQDLPLPSAGKTGTAEFGVNNEFKEGWYEGYAPTDNPKIAILALVEKGGEGFDSAEPVVHDVLKYYFTR